jgi:hypothetical protein
VREDSTLYFLLNTMASRPHSVPFIMPKAGDDNGQFEVRTEALEILSKIKTPVAPVAIVGKSHLILHSIAS